ncbi:B-cell receptor CD22-like [Python bivittatus]|uniref:B-cell receptor CD22 n=1 Tax=Python bivittatus TaxID=176946 RepID=A0A9F5JEY9_PYTBI|nr:B-cell receptor CD22-like [Python bivittatus]
MRCFLWLLVLPGSLGVPLSVTQGTLKAWVGSCVFISCRIKREYQGRPIEHVSFAWYFDPFYDPELKDYSGKLLYNSNQTAYSASPEFSNRVTFVGDLKNKNCSLKISQLHQNDSGKYSIRLYWKGGQLFKQGRWLEDVYIQVYESPLELIKLVSPEMRENIMNKVTCSVPYSCFYEPVTLTIQGLERHRLLFQEMTSENQGIQTELSLKPTWQDHRKQLTCLLKTHDGREIEKKFTELNVQYAPKGVRLKAIPGATVREGDNLSLECAVNSSNPDVISYQWFKDGIAWDSQIQPKKSFSDLKETDSGSYTCNVNNWIGSTNSDNLMISVQFLPKVKILMPQSPIREKDNVVLSCSATGNPPITGYEWYESSTPEIIKIEKELRFEPIEARHSGTYRCVVHNEIGNSSSSVTLNVHYCPKDVQLFHLNHLPIKEGDRVILNCSVGSSFPRNTWYNFLRSGDYTQKKQSSPVLTFFATATPVPSYQCEACNTVGCTTSPSITLDILYGPKDVKLNQEPSGWVIEGSSVRLTCTVRIANPQELSYTWYKDGQLLPVNSTKNMIFIQNVHSTNSGIYCCTSKNAISIVESLTVRLDVHYGPRNVRLTLDTQKAVTEGTDVYLRCDNDAYPSAVIYKWYWKGQEIFKETSKILALQKIKVEQSGEYLCKAFNHVSDKESQLMTISVSCEYFP